MHEFSIIENILTIVEEISVKEGLTSISKVSLLIGKMRQIVPDTMSFAFEAAAKGTIAESATWGTGTYHKKYRRRKISGNQGYEKHSQRQPGQGG